MEENTVKVDEFEGFEQIETEEAPESSNSGAFVAGIVGGLLAYAVIGGVKKLAAFAQTKWAGWRSKSETKAVVDVAFTEVSDEQENAEEASPEEK